MKILPTWEEKPFEPGEVIKFADELYTVIENYGTRGIVKDSNANVKFMFAWRCGDEDCIRVQQNEN